MEYNGVDLSNWVMVEQVENPPLPPIEITTQSAPGQNGARFVSKKPGTRTIKLKVVMAGNTRSEYEYAVDQVKSVLYAADVARLSGLPGDLRYYNATLSSWQMEKLMTIGHGNMEFFCADPFGYGLGKVIHCNVDDLVECTYGAIGTLRFTVPATIEGDIEIQLQKTGSIVRLFGPFSQGSQIAVDMYKGYATLNGMSMMPRVDIRSDWFMCKPGPVHILLTPGIITDGALSYVERWL